MAYKYSADATFKLDNASAALTAIGQYTNQSSLQMAFDMLETTGLGDAAKEFSPGTSGGTLPINGFVNTTTEAIFGPLVARTSITKTFKIGNGIKYYTGEAWPESVQFSGNVNELLTWSCTLRISGAVSRTSTTT